MIGRFPKYYAKLMSIGNGDEIIAADEFGKSLPFQAVAGYVGAPYREMSLGKDQQLFIILGEE